MGQIVQITIRIRINLNQPKMTLFKQFFILFFILVISQVNKSNAEIRQPFLISDGMVLQGRPQSTSGIGVTLERKLKLNSMLQS